MGKKDAWIEVNKEPFDSEVGGAMAAVSAAQELDEPVISIAALTGPNASDAEKADQELDKIYKSEGPSSHAFLAAFRKTPVSQLATLANMMRIAADFDAQTGQDSIALANAYAQKLGGCPFLIVSGTHSNKSEASFDSTSKVADLLVNNVVAKGKGKISTDLTEVIESRLNDAIEDEVEKVKMPIFGWWASANTNPLLSADLTSSKITITKEQPKPRKQGEPDPPPTYTFDVAFQVVAVTYNYGGSVEQYVGQFADQYTTIASWVEACSTPGLH